MKRLSRLLVQLPLFTTVGAFIGVFLALVAVVLSVLALDEITHPLALFAIAPLPAVLGIWLDWSRLWRPSPRTRFWSFALLGLTAVATVEAVVSGGPRGASAALVAPAVPFIAGVVVFFGARTLLFLTRRGLPFAGFELACGTVRRDESSRVVVDTPDGVLEILRSATQDLGSNRSIDLSIGSNIAVLGRVKDSGPGPDPFRTERRATVKAVLGVSSCPKNLAQTVRRRARAWSLYLLLLAAAASAFAGAASYEPVSDCQVVSAKWF